METMYDISNQWYCQYKFGCILFSLINSRIISDNIFSDIPLNFKSKNYDRNTLNGAKFKFLYELKIIIKWLQLTNDLSFKKDLDFIKSIYGKFKTIQDKTDIGYTSKVNALLQKLLDNADKFYKNEKRLAKLNLKVKRVFNNEDFNFEKGDCIFLEDSTHWVVIQEIYQDSFLVIDSLNPDNLVKISKSENVFKIIKNINKQNLTKYIDPIDFESEKTKNAMRQLRKYSYSESFNKLIKRLNIVNYSIKQDILEKIDSEINLYEYLN